jgi:histidinol phosphatase-like PHP family hydrolase
MHSRTEASISREYARQLDFVAVSATHLHSISRDVMAHLDLHETAAFMLDLTWGAIETGFADIIAHPFHAPMCRFSFAEIVGALDRDELGQLAQAAAAEGVAVECNPRFVRAAPEQAAWLFGRFLEVGCELSIGSDAHHPDNIGCRGHRYATEDELRAIGITEACLWRLGDTPTLA